MSDIYELLSSDHRKVSKLIEQIQETSNGAHKKREELFRKLKAELDAHSDAEEEVFYAKIEEDDEAHEMTLEAIEEHHLVSHLLEELDAMDKDSEEWLAKLKVLQENIEHHVEEEENELFDKARELLSSAEAEAIGDRFQEEKARLLKVS